MFWRKKRPALFKGEGLTNSTFENNTVSGDVDFIKVKHADNLKVSGNKHTTPDLVRDEKHWYEKPLGILILGVLVTLIGGALLFYFRLT